MAKTLVDCGTCGKKHYDGSANQKKCQGGAGSATKSNAGTADTALTDFGGGADTGEDIDPYDKAHDDLDNAFSDIGLDPQTDGIIFTDDDGRIMDYEKMQEDYAYQISEGGDAADLKMVITSFNTDNAFADAVNAKVLGLQGSSSEIGDGFEVDDDNNITISVNDIVEPNTRTDLVDITSSVTNLNDNGPYLNDSVASSMDYDASEKLFYEDNIQEKISERIEDDLDDYDEETGSKESFIASRREFYEDALTSETMTDTFISMRESGRIEQSELNFDKSTGEYELDDSVFDRILDETL